MVGSANVPKSGTDSTQRDYLSRKQLSSSVIGLFYSSRGSIGLCWLVDLYPGEEDSHLVIWCRSNFPIRRCRVPADFGILSPSVWYRRGISPGTLSDNTMVLVKKIPIA